MIPFHEKAKQIWMDSGGTATAVVIAETLADAGHRGIKPSTVRTWKQRYGWAMELASHAVEQLSIEEQEDFEQAVGLLRGVGIEINRKLRLWVKLQNPAAMDGTDAERISKISIDMMTTASMIDDKILSKQRQLRQASEQARVIDGEAHRMSSERNVNAVVAMFDKASRRT
jgi:hypothetical protein